MITIQVGDKMKQIMKNQVTLTFTLEGEKIEVDGKVLVGRPEDRIKK